jgi:hypothetical protein
MTVDDCVNAALAGPDLGEEITMPPVENVELLKDFDEARTALLIASQFGKPAIRYVNANTFTERGIWPQRKQQEATKKGCLLQSHQPSSAESCSSRCL